MFVPGIHRKRDLHVNSICIHQATSITWLGLLAGISEGDSGTEEPGPIAEEWSPGTGAVNGPHLRPVLWCKEIYEHVDEQKRGLQADWLIVVRVHSSTS